MHRVLRLIVRAIAIAVLVAAVAIAVPNVYEVATEAGHIRPAEEVEQAASQGETYDCILVLGASMLPSGEPSTILKDRLDVAVELYKAGVAPKIVMSGDNESDATYNEVVNMKKYAVGQGVPSEDIFCDHAGIDTYDSMYRARFVFNPQSMVVVTQTYHMYRALFDAHSFNIDAIGVTSDLHSYEKQAYFDIREVGARVSDMINVATNAEAAFKSAPVSLDSSGDATDW